LASLFFYESRALDTAPSSAILMLSILRFDGLPSTVWTLAVATVPAGLCVDAFQAARPVDMGKARTLVEQGLVSLAVSVDVLDSQRVSVSRVSGRKECCLLRDTEDGANGTRGARLAVAL
jgi:hypothetical protein